jgi:tetratricopeptide (TPR) repeat protein
VRAATDEIASARTMMDAHPDRLGAVNRLAVALLAMEQQDEVLKLTEAALAKALPADGSRSSYSDVDTQVNWTMDYRQRALYRAGRFDEAAAIEEKAARRPEAGHLNVSQAINLGDMYYALGRPKDALNAIADIAERDVSGYGALAADGVRICAAVQLHDDKLVQARLAATASHARDGAQPYASALLCVNDLDTLAKFYIDLLADKTLRIEALVQLQKFSLGEPRTAIETVIDNRRAQLLARPDMQAAIEKVGRSMTWALSMLPV